MLPIFVAVAIYIAARIPLIVDSSLLRRLLVVAEIRPFFHRRVLLTSSLCALGLAYSDMSLWEDVMSTGISPSISVAP